MRIRTIKPEFWSNEDMDTVSDKAKLLAIALLNYSDDEGYFRANPKLIKSALFPLRPSIKTTVLIQELSGIGYIELCKGSDDKEYGRVLKFTDHQVINKPKPSIIKELWTIPYEYGIDTVQVPAGTGNREQGKEQGTGADFDAFWKMVPNKIGKGKAREAYKNALKKKEVTHETIMKGLPGYIWYEKGRKNQEGYRPLHPSTWLNQERWADEIPGTPKKKGFDILVRYSDGRTPAYYHMENEKQLQETTDKMGLVLQKSGDYYLDVEAWKEEKSAGAC